LVSPFRNETGIKAEHDSDARTVDRLLAVGGRRKGKSQTFSGDKV